MAEAYGVDAGYEVEDFTSKIGQQLDGVRTSSLDQQRIPSIAVLVPGCITVDWGNNLSGIQAVLADHGKR